MIKRIYKYFSVPKHLAILNGLLLLIAIGLNVLLQVFCIPTAWVIVILIICFLNTVLVVFPQKKSINAITSFISGVSVMVFAYCILFLEHMNYFGAILMLMGIGLIVFIPHFFLVQLLWKNVFKPAHKSGRYFFFSAIIIGVLGIGFVGKMYSTQLALIKNTAENNYKGLTPNFMTEKIIGMHFIYHTQFCEYDGWRPPKHEPILVIGIWLNNREDPIKLNLNHRLKLYKHYFPENIYKFDCSCAKTYSSNYHNDPIWK
jgi:hypothetical protein